MKKIRIEKGITLIQLIITIIVLLILAAVAISGIQDQGIIEHAQNSTSEYNESLAQKDYLTKNYIEFLNANEGTGSGESDGTGETTGSDTGKITLNKTALSVEIESGSTATETLTATLTDATGTLILTWTSSNTDVATVTGSGNTVTVTIKKAGTATITVSYGESSATCNITVTVKAKEIKVGTYVEYDVSYTDMYQGTTYTSTNGWRYLGIDDSGNKLIISTAIPMKLYYHYLRPDGNEKWWDTTQSTYGDKMTQGLLKNFDLIPFAQKSSGTKLTGSEEYKAIGDFAPSTRTYNGEEYDAVGDYFKSSTYANKIENVRTLTLAELNTAVNKVNGNTDRYEQDISSGFLDLTGDALGLFDMQDLTGYTANNYYWLATKVANMSVYVYEVGVGEKVDFNYDNPLGVRPVVVLSADVQFKDDNGDGILEIQ